MIPALIPALLLLGTTCWLAVALWVTRDERDQARADYAAEVAEHGATAANRDHTRKLNAALLAGLTKARTEREAQRQLALILGAQLADTFAMPTVHGHGEESPAAWVQPSPIYDETVRYFASRRLGVVR